MFSSNFHKAALDFLIHSLITHLFWSKCWGMFCAALERACFAYAPGSHLGNVTTERALKCLKWINVNACRIRDWAGRLRCYDNLSVGPYSQPEMLPHCSHLSCVSKRKMQNTFLLPYNAQCGTFDLKWIQYVSFADRNSTHCARILGSAHHQTVSWIRKSCGLNLIRGRCLSLIFICVFVIRYYHNNFVKAELTYTPPTRYLTKSSMLHFESLKTKKKVILCHWSCSNTLMFTIISS